MIQLPKIKVEWVISPFAEIRTDRKIPILLFDDKIVKSCYSKDGQRPKYIGKEFVVKIDRAIGEHSYDYFEQAINEIEVWQRLDPSDRKYFIELLKYNKRERWIVQPFVKLTKLGITNEHRDVVCELAEKYGLTDIEAGDWGTHNWALDAKTKQPVIYDYGV